MLGKFKHTSTWGGIVALCAVLLTPASRAQSSGTVSTIGGAFAGHADGNNQVSQFNNPQGLALGWNGVLYIADKDNNAIRSLRLSDQVVTTIASVNTPVAVAVEGGTNILVVSQNAGIVARYDTFGNFRGNVRTGLVRPTAITVETNGTIYVAESAGTVRKIPTSGPEQTYTLNGFHQFEGVAVFENGKVAVSDAAQHVIWLFDGPGTQAQVLAGTSGLPGFVNGDPGTGRLSSPHHIAVGPNNSLVIADTGNHRVRVVSCQKVLDTLFGIDPAFWETFPDPSILPGWADGSSEFAESRSPVGIAVDSAGTVYDTETFYHIVRSASGLTFPVNCDGGNNSGGGGTVVQVPILTPNSGYYPMGVQISVTSTNGFTPDTEIYYTTDGSEPTTNSLPVFRTGDTGLILWREALRDLRSLRVKAFRGGESSPTVSGKAVPLSSSVFRGQVGVSGNFDSDNFEAGIGSQAFILPIIANLRENQTLRSLQFVVEVVAGPGAPRLENRTDISVLPMSTNNFVQVLPASTNLPNNSFSIVNGPTNRLAIAYIGTNGGFNINGFATVAMLSLKFRPGPDSLGNIADEGDQYRIKITQISGTSDGVQDLAALEPMPERTITLRNRSFLLGDTSPGFWYNASDFGNDVLENGDVNNAIFAAFGFRRPYDFTDAFYAMDVTRDNSIDFTDSEIILRRALGFDPNNFRRVRDVNGNWSIIPSAQGFAAASSPKVRMASVATEEPAWKSDVVVKAGVEGDIRAPGIASVPVVIRIDPGKELYGLQFVADIIPENGAPAINGVNFIPNTFAPAPSLAGSSVPGLGTLPATLYARWNNLEPGLSGTVELGRIEFMVPSYARQGQHYTIAFRNCGGAALESDGTLAPYSFESVRGSAWVFTAASELQPAVSDEWKVHFFGSVTAADANPALDADEDGFLNYEEYLAGSSPVSADWQVRTENGSMLFRWVGQTGKSYTVERTDNFQGWNAVTGRLTGQDAFLEYRESNPSKAQFYRIKIEQ